MELVKQISLVPVDRGSVCLSSSNGPPHVYGADIVFEPNFEGFMFWVFTEHAVLGSVVTVSENKKYLLFLYLYKSKLG